MDSIILQNFKFWGPVDDRKNLKLNPGGDIIYQQAFYLMLYL